jgi:alkylhydroperoxidase/carboxymuconolactone decarboxylase family protein YurZ
VKGLQLHIENAIGYGGTPQEILEIMEIASVLGIRAATSAEPILLKEIEAAGVALPDDKS